MRRLQHLSAFALLAISCVDPVSLSRPAAELPLIIEGHVDANPAPDTIRLSRAFPADGTFYSRIGVPGAKLWISDNAGTVDTLIDLTTGLYITSTLHGAIGKTYTLEGSIIDKDQHKTTFSSTPEQMLPAGIIDSIYFELTTKLDPATGLEEDGFNIFIDATVDASSSHRLRWKFNGTYVYITDPSAIQIRIPCLDPVCPYRHLDCAANCVCCTCWASEREDLPLVAVPTFLSGTTVKRVFVKYIPIDNFTFYEKYRVEVTQMELSQPVFDFYSGIRKQMVNANSLFQPPFFELDGNVKVVSGSEPLIGVFSAAAEAKAAKYIYRYEVPFNLAFQVLPGDCRAFAEHTVILPPPFWE